ncbi:hypothetical protein AB0I81_45790 [Nonomuraea sp. NPDC050404]|uniref:hypothetical protein n=1 Tax=Nonomuraea sp. NPDC050404 TaxID=3155783 RepID=UPI0033F8D997
MHKIARRAIPVSAAAIAATVIGLATASPASAVTWYSAPPTGATNVVNMASKSLPDGGTLQVRRGNYGNYAYYWGRVASPNSYYNTGHVLKFGLADKSSVTCASKDSTSKDINTTTYTSATRVKGNCLYYAEVINSSGRVVARAQYSA